MNRYGKFIYLFPFYCLSFLTSAQTLSIRSDTWFPINGDPDADLPGYMIEIASEILETKGFKVDYQVTPWARALLAVRQGQADCVVGAYKSDAPDFIFPEHPWGMDQNIFYVKHDTQWRYEDLNSLQTIRTGLIHEYSYAEELNNFANTPENTHLFEYTYSENALSQNISKVHTGRITATVESHLVMPEKLKSMNLEGELIEAGQIGPTIPMYIACSPAKPMSNQYIQWFDRGLELLRSSGRLNEILTKYNLTDWQHNHP